MARFVLGLGPRAHVGTGALRELGWLTVYDRVRYFSLLHVFRVNKGLGPSYLKRGFTRVQNVHGHETRASALGYHISGGDIGGTFGYHGKRVECNS